MAYTPTTWKDRLVEFANKYAKSGETSTEVTLTSSPGVVTEEGTPLSATNLNKIEDGIAAADAGLTAHEADSAIHTTQLEKDKLAGIEAGAEVNDVTSVAGKVGAVALVKADVGLGSVDNLKQSNAIAVGSAADPNTTQESYIITNNVNNPTGGGTYFHIQTLFYSTLTGNRAQIAVDYNAGTNAMYHRRSMSGAWSGWTKIRSELDSVQTRITAGQLQFLDGGVWKPVGTDLKVLNAKFAGQTTTQYTGYTKIDVLGSGYLHGLSYPYTAAILASIYTDGVFAGTIHLDSDINGHSFGMFRFNSSLKITSNGTGANSIEVSYSLD